MTTMEEALAALDPKIRKRLSNGVGFTTTFQKTPSHGLNRALNGGLPYGRQVLIWGSKSSAKSSLCLQMIALAQEEGKLCAWIDAEMSYSEEWAKNLGVDTDNLIVSQARTINEMVDVGTALMNAGVDLIVIDSITSLLRSWKTQSKLEQSLETLATHGRCSTMPIIKSSLLYLSSLVSLVITLVLCIHLNSLRVVKPLSSTLRLLSSSSRLSQTTKLLRARLLWEINSLKRKLAEK
jgi:archaellum biogenesis ATPase FlaH